MVYRGRNLGPHRALSRQGKESRQLRLLEFLPILYRTSAKLDSEELADSTADSDVHQSPINEQGNKIKFLLS